MFRRRSFPGRRGIEQEPVMPEHFPHVDVVESQPGIRRPNHVRFFGRSGGLRGVRGGRRRDERPSGAAASPRTPRGPALDSHHLEYLAGFESRPRKKHHGARHVPGLHADHVRIFVVSEIRDFLGLIRPRVPYHRVGKIVFLYPHLPSRHHVRDDVLLRSVLVNSVSPFTYSNYITAFLVSDAFPRLNGSGEKKNLISAPIYFYFSKKKKKKTDTCFVYEGTSVKPCDLTSPNVRAFKVGVQEQIKTEG